MKGDFKVLPTLTEHVPNVIWKSFQLRFLPIRNDYKVIVSCQSVSV